MKKSSARRPFDNSRALSYMGRGASIRITRPNGETVNHDPKRWAKNDGATRFGVIQQLGFGSG